MRGWGPGCRRPRERTANPVYASRSSRRSWPRSRSSPERRAPVWIGGEMVSQRRRPRMTSRPGQPASSRRCWLTMNRHSQRARGSRRCRRLTGLGTVSALQPSSIATTNRRILDSRPLSNELAAAERKAPKLVEFGLQDLRRTSASAFGEDVCGALKKNPCSGSNASVMRWACLVACALARYRPAGPAEAIVRPIGTGRKPDQT
jgi:hypothetical protein